MSENHHTAPGPGTDGLDASDPDHGMDAVGRPLTVADVLTLPALAAGQPQVITRVAEFGRPIHWVTSPN